MSLHTNEELFNKIEAALNEAANIHLRLVGFQQPPARPARLLAQLDSTAVLAREALQAVQELKELTK